MKKVLEIKYLLQTFKTNAHFIMINIVLKKNSYSQKY